MSRSVDVIVVVVVDEPNILIAERPLLRTKRFYSVMVALDVERRVGLLVVQLSHLCEIRQRTAGQLRHRYVHHVLLVHQRLDALGQFLVLARHVFVFLRISRDRFLLRVVFRLRQLFLQSFSRRGDQLVFAGLPVLASAYGTTDASRRVRLFARFALFVRAHPEKESANGKRTFLDSRVGLKGKFCRCI